jgi:hypothetical protein
MHIEQRLKRREEHMKARKTLIALSLLVSG